MRSSASGGQVKSCGQCFEQTGNVGADDDDKEPDDSMIEVAIRAVEEVFDWKAYLEENFSKTGGIFWGKTSVHRGNVPYDLEGVRKTERRAYKSRRGRV